MKPLTLLLLAACPAAFAADMPPYKDASLPVEVRTEDLLSRMTLREKVLQINQYVHGKEDMNLNPALNNFLKTDGRFPLEAGSFIYFNTDPQKRNALQKQIMEESRLGIPALFAYDILHGYNTIYTIPLGLACSWNPGLATEAAAMAAREARASGVDWAFGPMVDVGRDARWGRISETFGEDTYANSVFGAAMVRGYQGDDLKSPESVAATMKHFVGYSEAEGGRDYQQTEISNFALWNSYLPPFKAGIDAGAATIMSGLNEFNGIPTSANYYTLTEILRKMWSFEGVVVSDWDSVGQLKDYNHTAADYAEASAQALMAGVDIDMCGGNYSSTLDSLVSNGVVPMTRLDEAVRRVLELKFKLGLFENPYIEEVPRSKRLFLPEYRQTAERVAEETCVLLKNDGSVLPAKGRRIAAIGPTLDNDTALVGDWHGRITWNNTVTLRKALEKEFGRNIGFTRGCDFDGADTTGFAEARRLASKADVILLCMGERGFWSGENKSRADISLRPVQRSLIAELHRLGKPMVLVLSNGRPMPLADVEPMLDGILEIWQPGSVGAYAVAGILSGRVNPTGKLSVTFPGHSAQAPLYYCSRRGGRYSPMGDYKDMPTRPLYPFGHGLSYTTYEYGNLRADSDTVGKNGEITISVDVTNTGGRDGAETVLWYVTDEVASRVQPFKLLKHFEKKPVKKGQTVTFSFTVKPWRDLSFYDDLGTPVLEDGDFTIAVGDKKMRIKLKN